MTGSEQGEPDNGEAGFSLVEMLVALAILSLVATVAVPAIRPPSQKSLSLLSSEIAARMRVVRARALVAADELPVTFDTRERILHFGGGVPSQPLPPDTSLTLRGTITRQGEPVSISFFADGSSTGGAIVLTRNAETRSVTVNWLTGVVATEETSARER